MINEISIKPKQRNFIDMWNNSIKKLYPEIAYVTKLNGKFIVVGQTALKNGKNPVEMGSHRIDIIDDGLLESVFPDEWVGYYNPKELYNTIKENKKVIDRVKFIDNKLQFTDELLVMSGNTEVIDFTSNKGYNVYKTSIEDIDIFFDESNKDRTNTIQVDNDIVNSLAANETFTKVDIGCSVIRISKSILPTLKVTKNEVSRLVIHTQTIKDNDSIIKVMFQVINTNTIASHIYIVLK